MDPLSADLIWFNHQPYSPLLQSPTQQSSMMQCPLQDLQSQQALMLLLLSLCLATG
jgi:hypothetical protein